MFQLKKGGIIFANRQRHWRAAKLSPFMKAVATGHGEGKISPKNVHVMIKLLQDYGDGATIVALGPTSISIYTGIKGIICS